MTIHNYIRMAAVGEFLPHAGRADKVAEYFPVPCQNLFGTAFVL